MIMFMAWEGDDDISTGNVTTGGFCVPVTQCKVSQVPGIAARSMHLSSVPSSPAPACLVPTRSMSNEKIAAASRFQELLEMKGCRAFVIKLSVVGGLARAVRLCHLSKRVGATPVLS